MCVYSLVCTPNVITQDTISQTVASLPVYNVTGDTPVIQTGSNKHSVSPASLPPQALILVLPVVLVNANVSI